MCNCTYSDHEDGCPFLQEDCPFPNHKDCQWLRRESSEKVESRK